MNVMGKLVDYKLIETKNGEPKVVLTFKTTDDRVFSYFGSLDRTEKTSPTTGVVYSFYGITKSVLETCGLSKTESLTVLEDQDRKKSDPAMSLGKEFDLEIREYQKEGKTYSSVYKIKRDKSIGFERAKELFGDDIKKTGTSEDDISF
jgi:hypothetical protein